MKLVPWRIQDNLELRIANNADISTRMHLSCNGDYGHETHRIILEGDEGEWKATAPYLNTFKSTNPRYLETPSSHPSKAGFTICTPCGDL